MPTPSQKILRNLNSFYQRPIAKVSLELFLSVGAIVFFALFAIRPTLLIMSDLIKEIEDKRKLDTQLTQKIAALSTVQNTYLRLQDDLFVLDEALPNDPQVIETAKLIEKLAGERSLLIDSLNIKNIPQTKSEIENPQALSLLTYPLVVTVIGDYPGIRAFTQDLLNLRRTLMIDTVLFRTSEEKGERQLQAVITLVAPYFGEEVALKKK